MQTSLCPFCLKMVQAEICPYCGKDVNYPGYPNHLPVGFTLNGRHPYVMGAAIGQGGFGITYIAIDAATNQRVAIKEYYPNHCCGRNNSTYVVPSYGQEDTFAKGKQHFLEEAQMLQDLSEIESIVKVLDYFEANNAAYLVMEFLDGVSLKEYVDTNGKMSASVFLQQLKPLMEDMEKMHRRGVIHRDIAPDNIIMLADGQLKLIDFGAARSYVGDKSMTVVVKKGFAPVEQYMRKGSNASTDVYALAATIYYCLTGVIPPDSAARQYGEEVMVAPSLLGADLMPRQEYALEKALELQPKDRIQSIAGLGELLFAEAAKPSGQQIIWEENCRTLQESCPVMVESLQLVYDYDRDTAVVKPVLRSLTDDCLQSVAAELWCGVSGGGRVLLAQFEIPCERVKRNEFFSKEHPATLPMGELHDVCLTITGVTFKNGKQISCGSASEAVEEQEPLERIFGSAEILQQYQLETTEKAAWKPISGGSYWRCCCGHLNLSSEADCGRCGTNREKQFDALNPERLAAVIAERKAEATRIAEERARIAAEEAAKRREARKQKLRRGSKIAVAAVAAVAVIWIGSAAFTWFKYTSAEKSLEAGNFEKAYAAYAELDDYRDSREKKLEVKYAQAENLEKAEKYQDAVRAYEAAAGYKDSVARAAYCRKEVVYAAAQNLYAVHDFEEAYKLFTQLQDHRDSGEYANLSAYHHAKKLSGEKQYHDAYVLFMEIGDYKDSVQLGQEAEYQYAMSCMKAGQYEESATAFVRIKTYKDAEKQYREAAYQYAEQLMEEAQWQEAAKWYSGLGNHLDSESKYKEARYQFGCAELDNKNYASAVAVFDSLGNYKQSGDKIREAKYQYVLAHKSKRDTTTWQYLKSLKEKNYKDSAKIYEELYAWKVTLVAVNTTKNDNTTIRKSVPRDVRYLHFEFKLEGGGPGESVTLTPKYFWPNGNTLSSDWDWEDIKDGEMFGVYWDGEEFKFYQNPQQGATGKMTIKVYNKETRQCVGEGSVEITK